MIKQLGGRRGLGFERAQARAYGKQRQQGGAVAAASALGFPGRAAVTGQAQGVQQ